MSDTSDRFTRPGWEYSRPGPRAAPLRRDEALALLREHAPEIERRTNIRPVALFGSVARDEATVDSDVDVLAELAGRVGWTELAQAEVYLEMLFEARVDLVFWDTLKPRVRPYITADLLNVA